MLIIKPESIHHSHNLKKTSSPLSFDSLKMKWDKTTYQAKKLHKVQKQL